MLSGKAATKIVLVMATIMILVGVSGAWRYFTSIHERVGNGDLRLFRGVFEIVKKSYVEEVNSKKLLEGAINGMLASLDPHSAYLPPEPYSEMKVEMSGSFGGLGIEITINDGKLTVIAPIEDTPAWRAGIQSGDHIWKIDDKPTRGLTITEAVKRMRGPKDTRVTLAVLRNGEGKPRVFPLVRDIIKTKSVRSRTLEPGYGYARISQFSERTGEEFKAVLERLRSDNGGNLKGLVLDLRNNPGGLLDMAVAVAGRFVGGKMEDGLVVSIKGRGPLDTRDLYASLGQKEPVYPLVVLVNGGSASASEIVAGALQDHGRAVIMGTQTFGKGSVQSVIPLRDNAGLKLTTARYYTPKGRSIQAKGITPDIVVPRADMETAAKPKEKERPFSEADLENHLTPDSSKKQETQPPGEVKKQPTPLPLLGEDAAKDNQLLRAVELLKGWQAVRKVSGSGGR